MANALPDAGQAITVLLLHPGDMGAALGANWRARGHRVLWVESGRSAASAKRASDAGLEAMSLNAALECCHVVVSVCPPSAAEAVADQVLGQGYQGIYIDANAIAPQTSAKIDSTAGKGGASFVDGGIIGPPPRGHVGARLYLSGPNASRVAPLLAGGTLETHALGGAPNQASALKMAFAAWNKGRLALMANVHALADTHDVLEPLRGEWARLDPDAEKREHAMLNSAHKAWRWAGEMLEIADTFTHADLPNGFHVGAAQVYERLERFKDVATAPSLEAVNKAMRTPARK